MMSTTTTTTKVSNTIGAATSASAPMSLSDRAYSSLLTFMPGAVAGAMQAVVGHPFDTIKTKCQASAFVASAPPAGTSLPPKSGAAFFAVPPSCRTAVQIYRRDGVLGFYRGVTVPIYINSVKRSMQYTIWDRLKDLKLDPFLSGSLTGAFGTVTFGCPAHVIKVHSQVIGDRNAFAAARYVFERKGLRGFYAGLPANLAKDIVFAGCYLGLYEKYKQVRPAASYAEAAAVASVFVWSVFLPIDTVKTAFQSPDRAAALELLRRQRDNVVSLLRPRAAATVQNGAAGGNRLRSLATALRRAYAGLLPAIVRAGPANAVSMSCYEWAKSYSRKKQQAHNDRMQKAAPAA